MFKTNIAFSQVREDPELDLQTLNLVNAKDKKALIIGSGGCSLLTMLLCPDLKSIDVLDGNKAQIDLIKLKIEAFRQLSNRGYLEFIESGGRDDKIDLFYYLKEHSIYDLTAWETKEKQAEIAYGINQVGVFEQLFKSLREQLGKNPLNEEVDDDEWNNAFEKVFNRNNLIESFGEEAVKYSMSKEFVEHFSSVMSTALLKYKDQENYFLNQIFDGKYKNDLPIYLLEENKATILSNLDKINFIENNLVDYMKGTDKTYDFIHTSNITDWMPLNDIFDLYDNIKKKTNKGGMVISRRLNGDHQLKCLVSKHLKTDNIFVPIENRASPSSDLKDNDKSFFYNEVFAGQKDV